MNVIDIVILAIIAISVLFGFYRGFIQTVLKLGGCLLSFVGAFFLFPKLSDVVSSNPDITRLIGSYTDAGSLLGDLDLSNQVVSTLSEGSIAQIVQKANLPTPIDNLLQHNLASQVFAPLGQAGQNVGDYVNQTLISVSINVLCFVACFAICFLVLSVVINMLRAVFNFPVLRQLDWLVGGVFGFGIGLAVCFVFFTLLPIVEAVVPMEEFRVLVDQSQLAKLFENGNLIVAIMNRKLL